MALTVIDLAVSLRVIATAVQARRIDPAVSGLLNRLLGSAQALVGSYASPGTPEPVTDQAVILVAAYLWEQPSSARGTAFSTAWINSGAAGLVEPWRVRRAGLLGGEGLAVVPGREAPGAVPAPEPGGATTAALTAAIAAHAALPNVHHAPTAPGASPADIAAAIATHAALPNVHHAPGLRRQAVLDLVASWAAEGNRDLIPPAKLGSVTVPLVLPSGVRLPDVPRKMHLGWSNTRGVASTPFERANGQTLGTTDGVIIPDRPSSLAGRSHYLHIWIQGTLDIFSLGISSLPGDQKSHYPKVEGLFLNSFGGIVLVSSRAIGPFPSGTTLSVVRPGELVASGDTTAAIAAHAAMPNAHHAPPAPGVTPAALTAAIATHAALPNVHHAPPTGGGGGGGGGVENLGNFTGPWLARNNADGRPIYDKVKNFINANPGKMIGVSMRDHSTGSAHYHWSAVWVIPSGLIVKDRGVSGNPLETYIGFPYAATSVGAISNFKLRIVPQNSFIQFNPSVPAAHTLSVYLLS